MRKVLKFLVIPIFLVGLGGLLWTVYKFYKLGDFNIDDIHYEKIGGIGDFLGGFYGTLITIATIILVWLTYQSQEEELKDTKKLLADQTFESTFFNLMTMFKDTINNMDIDILKSGQIESNHAVQQTVKGRDCFKFFIETLKKYIKGTTGNQPIENAPTFKAEILSTYSFHESDLGPYYKMIKNIIIRIESKEDNQFYIDTFNSNFSAYELVLMNYLMFTYFFTPDEKKLICKFRILDGLDIKKLLKEEDRYECKPKIQIDSITPVVTK